MDNQTFILLLVFLLLAMGCHPPNSTGATFYLQVVRGADSGFSPTKDSKPVGQKLLAKLRCAFKWKHYWEIKCDTLSVPRHRKIRDAISPDQTVEVELMEPDYIVVRIYDAGHLVRSRRQPAMNAFCVMGAPIGVDQSRFVVLRGDKPQPADEH